MFHITLYQPEIPPNTGNIIRLCVNSGCQLHLIEPLGFIMDDKRLSRAALDYADKSKIHSHQDFATYLYATNPDPSRIFLCSTKANTCYADISFKPGDHLIFGPETRGLPSELLQQYPEDQKIKIPMHPHGRSLNLATAVAIIGFEAWRQNSFQV